MIEVTILIPLFSNDGERFSASHHKKFEALAARTFSGVTRLPGEARGVWLDGGTRYDDQLIGYLVALPSITDGGKLGRLIDRAKRHYRQEAIFFRYLGRAEIR